MNSLLDFSGHIFENSRENLLLFLSILIAGFLFKKFLSVRISRLLYSTLKDYSNGVSKESFEQLLIKPMNALILSIFIYLAFDRLSFPTSWHLVSENQFGLRMILFRGYHVAIIVTITWILLRLIDFFALVLLKRAALTATRTDDQVIPFLKDGIKLIVTAFAFMIILGTVFHVNVTSIIAGLGIGGLAVALAAKETLENLLGSFTIFMDKPFELGDLVKVGNVTGTVEKIGFRSTRIRSLEKSYVTVPNKKMVDAETENLSLRSSRRAKLLILIDHQTKPESLAKVGENIKQLIESNPLSDIPECNVHFYSIGHAGFELRIEVYFKLTVHKEFLREKETLNFQVLNLLHEQSIRLAVNAFSSNSQ